MKKIFAIMLAAAAMTACSSGKKYTISGTDSAFEDGMMVYLQIPDEANGRLSIIDSVEVANNSFLLKGDVPEGDTKQAYITLEKQDAGTIYISLFLEPGKINVLKEFPEDQAFCTTGTALNDLRNEFGRTNGEFNKQYAAAREAGDNAAAAAVEKQMVAFYNEFAVANADNAVGQDVIHCCLQHARKLRQYCGIGQRFAAFPLAHCLKGHLQPFTKLRLRKSLSLAQIRDLRADLLHIHTFRLRHFIFLHYTP